MNNSGNLHYIVLVFLLIILYSCKKETIPTLTTVSVTDIAATTATSGGSITSDGGAGVTERGICWGTTTNPSIAGERTVDGNGAGDFISYMKCLSFATTYYVRAYATNRAGTAYGDQLSFTTLGTNPIIFNPGLTYGYVADIDLNCYKTIKIGTQTWMAENLKTTRYNDGTEIPLVIDNPAWENLFGYDEHTGFPYVYPGYCWYGNDIDMSKSAYGALYNFSVVSTRKLCPSGWHVADIDEWDNLLIYFGGQDVAAGKLKEVDFMHWQTPNSGADNSSGFTALPGGIRGIDGNFDLMGYYGSWWTASGEFRATGLSCSMFCDNVKISSAVTSHANNAYSVRCIQDN